MNMDIIIGNVCSIGAMICDSFSGTRKNKKQILLIQCISQVFYIISSIVLKGYSAVVQNVVAIFRNIFVAFEIKNIFLEILFIVLPVVLGFMFNNRGLMGVLPIAANLEYSIAMFVFKDDPKKLKIAFVINSSFYCIFNFYLLNIMGGIFKIITIVTTLISLYKDNKERAKL